VQIWSVLSIRFYTFESIPSPTSKLSSSPQKERDSENGKTMARDSGGVVGPGMG